MPYVGKEPVRGQNRELDDISGTFNGGNTAFTMQVGGVNTANGLSFWGLIQGDAVDIQEPADGSVTAAKLASGAGIAVLTGSTNNTITTVTGAGAIQGEANLTFDGSTLEVSSSTPATVKINDTGGYQGYIQMRGNDLEIRGSSGQIEFYQGNADGASSSEKFRISSHGGVTFNGDTAAANCLDDYEEGTWSPSPRFGGSGTGTSGSYNGQYVKIGKQVTIWFNVGLTDKGSFSSGDAYTIVNLPFTGSSSAYSGFAPGYVHRMSTSKQLLATINNAATIDLGLASTGSGVNNDTCAWGDVQDDTHIIGTMTYFV